MKVQVHMGSRCMLYGAMNILEQLESLEELRLAEPWRFNEEVLEIEAVPCSVNCKTDRISPVVIIEGESIHRATSQQIMEKVMSKILLPEE